MIELPAIVAALASPHATGGVLVTLVSAEGSSYRRPGARLLIGPSGYRIGSISGGCLEEDVLARSRKVQATGIAEAVVYDTTSENDLVWGVGLGCHGVVRVLLEPLDRCPPWAGSLAANAAARTTLDGADEPRAVDAVDAVWTRQALPRMRVTLVPQTGQMPLAKRRPLVSSTLPVNARFSLHFTQ